MSDETKNSEPVRFLTTQESRPMNRPTVDPVGVIEAAYRRAIRSCTGLDRDPMIRPCRNPEHGDYQVNGIIPLARELGVDAVELARRIAKEAHEQER